MGIAAQTTISGIVTDASDGKPLNAATLQVENTYRGTVTNSDGAFRITVPSVPAVLLVRFIGYESARIELAAPPTEPLQIRLKPIQVEMREVVVTGEDPALHIMRQVIRRKQEWRARLENYQAEAYSRQRLENDTAIVTITESVSDAYWDRKRGTREVIRWKQQTSNVDATENFAAATFIPNLYDDNIEIMGFDMVGPTHPDALDFYHFKLEGFRQIDDRTIFDIRVWPKRRLQPTFVGMIAVQDVEYAMILADLKPSESVLFPPPIQEFGLHYAQQYRDFGDGFWLPVDVRIEGTIRIGFPGLRFPPFNFHQLSRLDRYRVNEGVPDSLYELNRRLTVDSLSVASGRNPLAEADFAVPLDAREQATYARNDSTMTFEKAFRPTGALARFVEMDEESDGDSGDSRPQGPFGRLFGGLAPQLWYNRSSAVHLGGTYRLPVPGKVRYEVQGGYDFGPETAFYGGRIFRNGTWGWSAEYRYGLETRHQDADFNLFMTSMMPVFGLNDYHDLYRSEKVSVEVSRAWRALDGRWTLSAYQERVSSVGVATNWSIPGGVIQPPVPAVNAGTYAFVRAGLQAGEVIPFGVLGGNSFAGFVEASDAGFVRARGEVTFRMETFLRRRFLPNVLDVLIQGGTVLGDPKAPYLNRLDGSLGWFTPFGTLKTLPSAAYEGRHAVAVHLEHNFRTVPFELLGLDGLAKKGVGVILTASGAKTWDGPGGRYSTGGIHREVGVSINSLFGLLRVDTSYRLDRPGFYAGLSFARFF